MNWPHGRAASELHSGRLASRKNCCGKPGTGAGWGQSQLPAGSVIVLQVFDNIAYYAVTSEDTIIPCRKDVSGRYHVDGDLLLSPYIRNCLPIIHQLEDLPKIVLSPLPRYLTQGCCTDQEHASNRVEEGFRWRIISGAERLRKAIRDQLLESGIRNFKVYNPLWLPEASGCLGAAGSLRPGHWKDNGGPKNSLSGQWLARMASNPSKRKWTQGSYRTKRTVAAR